jgi:indolepyruvate ferredoxin oxidoreductase
VIERCAADLVAYQDARYAAGYRTFVERVASKERAVDPNSDALTRTVAISLHKLMAYKDEYEVARLMVDPDALAEARRLARGGSISWRLHPPMLKALGMERKISVPMSAAPLVRALARGKRLRGTRLDPFGRAEVRREEQRLPAEYRATIERLLASLTSSNLAAAAEIAALPQAITGYEDLKLRRIAEYRSAAAAALSAWQ